MYTSLLFILVKCYRTIIRERGMMTCNGVVVLSHFLGEYFHPMPFHLVSSGRGIKRELGLGLIEPYKCF